MAGYIYLTLRVIQKRMKSHGKVDLKSVGISLMILAPAIMAIMGFLLLKNSTYF